MLPGPEQSSFTCKGTVIPLLIIHPVTKSLSSPCDERQGKTCWSVTFRIRHLTTLFKIRSERSWKQLWSNSLCRERPFWTSYLLVMLLICHAHDLIKSILFSVNFEHSPLCPVARGSGGRGLQSRGALCHGNVSSRTCQDIDVEVRGGGADSDSDTLRA